MIMIRIYLILTRIQSHVYKVNICFYEYKSFCCNRKWNHLQIWTAKCARRAVFGAISLSIVLDKMAIILWIKTV